MNYSLTNERHREILQSDFSALANDLGLEVLGDVDYFSSALTFQAIVPLNSTDEQLAGADSPLFLAYLAGNGFQEGYYLFNLQLPENLGEGATLDYNIVVAHDQNSEPQTRRKIVLQQSYNPVQTARKVKITSKEERQLADGTMTLFIDGLLDYKGKTYRFFLYL